MNKQIKTMPFIFKIIASIIAFVLGGLTIIFGVAIALVVGKLRVLDVLVKAIDDVLDTIWFS